MNPILVNIVNPIQYPIHIARPWMGGRRKEKEGGRKEGKECKEGEEGRKEVTDLQLTQKSHQFITSIHDTKINRHKQDILFSKLRHHRRQYVPLQASEAFHKAASLLPR